jgi:hypothetical protein
MSIHPTRDGDQEQLKLKRHGSKQTVKSPCSSIPRIASAEYFGRQAHPQTFARHSHLIMQTPTTAQIRTAIEVLKKFGEHINHNAANLVVQLLGTHLGDRCAARVEVLEIKQVSRTHTLAAQLESWRDQLLQASRRCVSNHV